VVVDEPVYSSLAGDPRALAIATVLAVDKTVALTVPALSDGLVSSRSAARPATCGAAIEVPLIRASALVLV
jgi:hypothetical protein